MTITPWPGTIRSKALFMVATAAALVSAACGLVEPDAPPIGEEFEEPAVRVTLGRSRSTPTADRAAHIFATFDPVLLRGSWAQGGVLDSPQWSPMDLHPVESMRVCFSRSGPCQPEGEWQPYELIVERTVTLTGEGTERIWIGAEFQDVDGRPVPAFVDPSAPQNLISTSLRLP